MKLFFERFFIPLLVGISLLYAIQSLGNEAVRIVKVFHHGSNNVQHIELGSLVFYFSREPIINLLQVKNLSPSEEERIFFFPHAVIGGRDGKQMINRINKGNYPYQLQIKSVTEPTPGIQLAIRYKVHDVAIAYEAFESISLQKGLVFHLYNKQLLERLRKQQQQPILRTSWNNEKPRVVIDCGHGGSDTGTIGVGGIQEKNVCLSVGNAVVALLQGQGVDVVRTRANDRTVLLDERTAIANTSNADLFISIHANSASNQQAVGIETFCTTHDLLRQHTAILSNEDKALVAAFCVQKDQRSRQLAYHIQEQACKAVSTHHNQSINRKVKHAVAQVLLGTQMPCVLIEVGFLSNQHEAQLLATPSYQKQLAYGICNGVMAYFA